MNKIFLSLSIATGISAALCAQEPQNTQVPGPPPVPGATEALRSPQAAQPPVQAMGAQTLSGVLMDAGCSAISSNSALKTYSANSSATPSTTARIVTESETRVRDAGAPPVADLPAPRSTTEESASRNANSADPASAITTRDVPSSLKTAETRTPPAAAETGERGRAIVSDPTTSSSFTAVREKYRDCMVKLTTTSFAIHSDGRLITLDDASNELMRRQLTSDHFRSGMTDSTGKSKWMSVNVDGSMQGDRISVTSVKP